MQTFVFADLAGYTALTEAHGDEHAADTAAAFCQAVRSIMDDYGAEEIKTIGDAILLRVPEADDAVRLAARLVGDHGARHDALSVRIGMHTGIAVCRDGDWFGAAVNIAARVSDLANAGEVLLTSATADAAGDALAALRPEPRGLHHLRHVREPVELYALRPASTLGRALAVDPVCRMTVDPARAPRRTVHQGRQHVFCSEECADAFVDAPERYTRSAPAP